MARKTAPADKKSPVKGAATIPERVERFLRIHGVSPGETVLVACSGGADSISLVHAVAAIHGDTVAVGHIDHGIRDRESRGIEREVVDTLGAELGVPVLRRTLPEDLVVNRAREERGSTEEIARRLRYECLTELAGECRARTILTGHHREDFAETVLMRALTGRSALEPLGIPEERHLGRDASVRILRPLLDFSRQELRDFARRRGVSFLDDPTNTDPRYMRNRVRSRVFPVIAESFPDYDIPSTLQRFARDVERMRRGITALIPDDAWGEYGESSWRIDLGLFSALPSAAREIVLRNALYRYSTADRLSFKPFRVFLHGDVSREKRVTAGGICMESGVRYLELARRVVRTGRKGYLFTVHAVGGTVVRWSPRGVTVERETASGEGVPWWIGPAAPPAIIRPRRAGERTPAGSGTGGAPSYRWGPVLEDREGVLTFFGAAGPISARNGVQCVRRYHRNRQNYVGIRFVCEDC